MDTMLKVSTQQIEFELGPNDERAYYKLEFQNLNPTKNIGFRIKSTNVDRYVVSPTADVMEPSQKLMIDIVLHLKKSDLDLSQIDDKFAIFYMEVDEDLTKQQLEKFLKQNAKQQQKQYIRIKIKRAIEEQPLTKSRQDSQTQEQNVEEVKQQFTNSRRRSMPLTESQKESIINPQVDRKQAQFTNADTSYLTFKNNIYEKDQLIQKLKKEKKILEQNLQKIQQVIKDQKTFQNSQQPKKIQNFFLFLIFFIGLVIGALFNSY